MPTTRAALIAILVCLLAPAMAMSNTVGTASASAGEQDKQPPEKDAKEKDAKEKDEKDRRDAADPRKGPVLSREDPAPPPEKKDHTMTYLIVGGCVLAVVLLGLIVIRMKGSPPKPTG
jgi:hypothetical protein